MRLRRRLTVWMAVLLIVGLSLADLVTYTSLRSFLYGRLDDQLAASQSVAARFLIYASKPHPHHRRFTQTQLSAGLDNQLSTEIFALVISPKGVILATRASGSGLRPDPVPVIPRSIRLATQTEPGRGAYHPDPDDFNVSSRPKSGQSAISYRARASAVPQGTVVTAVALTSTDATLANLIRIELGVSAGVLVVLCLVALWTVRRGLRPLEDMTVTAGAIASGDLSQRVETADPTTEVGRLGTALNAMLVQIEAGFDEKSATEARLRQFVADASHELRTPLTSIRGYAELLRKGAFTGDDERLRALQRVESEAARMGGLVDDLLLLARLDQGRPLDQEPVDLRRVLHDAVDDVHMAVPERVVTLSAPVAVTVAGDRDRLAQVAHNLVRNAVVHTPPGSPIEVELTTRNHCAVLRVVDHGPGLTPQRVERVFDRFYRGDSARTGQGTGLGLSIVRAIAEALGGRAWAERNPGGGTTFAVEVPLVEMPPGALGTHRGADVAGARHEDQRRRLSESRRRDRRPPPGAPAVNGSPGPDGGHVALATRAPTSPDGGPRGPASA